MKLRLDPNKSYKFTAEEIENLDKIYETYGLTFDWVKSKYNYPHSNFIALVKDHESHVIKCEKNGEKCWLKKSA